MPTGTVRTMTDARVFVGGFDLSGQANQVDIPTASGSMNDVTTFGSGGDAEFRPGIRKTQINVSTYVDEALIGSALRVGTSGLVCTVCDDDAEFAPGWSIDGVSMSNNREMVPGGVVKAALSLEGTGKLYHGELLLPRTVDTNGGNGSSRQLGAVAADERLYASLHVFAVTGGGLTVKVQSDNATGFPSATDRISFTAATAVGSQFASVAGAITDDWFRVSWQQTATSATFAVLVGVQ